MDDHQAALIVAAIDQCLVLPNLYLLIALPSDLEDGLYVFWDPDRLKWSATKEVDPLTCLLLSKQPERCKEGDDNQVVASLCATLQRRPAWVRSFLDGWFGPNNCHGSISGYFLGHRLRRKYQCVDITPPSPSTSSALA